MSENTSDREHRETPENASSGEKPKKFGLVKFSRFFDRVRTLPRTVVQKLRPAKKSDAPSPETSENEGAKKGSRLKKTARIVGWTLLAILLILVLLVIFRDFVITKSITGIGSWLTGTKITIEKFETSLSEGDVRITNLKIANPDGYDRPSLLELDSFYLNIGVKSLLSDTILIEEIDVNGLRLTCEFSGKGRFNLVHLVDNIEEKIPPDDKPKEKPENPKTVSIDTLNVSNSSITVRDDRVGVSVPLPLVWSSSQTSFKESGNSLINILADWARFMQDKCNGVANAKELFTDAGKKIWDGTGSAGKKVVDFFKW